MRLHVSDFLGGWEGWGWEESIFSFLLFEMSRDVASTCISSIHTTRMQTTVGYFALPKQEDLIELCSSCFDGPQLTRFPVGEQQTKQQYKEQSQLLQNRNRYRSW